MQVPTTDFCHVSCQSSSCRETLLSIRCRWRSSRKQLSPCWRYKGSRPQTAGTFRKQQVQSKAAACIGRDGWEQTSVKTNQGGRRDEVFHFFGEVGQRHTPACLQGLCLHVGRAVIQASPLRWVPSLTAEFGDGGSLSEFGRSQRWFLLLSEHWLSCSSPLILLCPELCRRHREPLPEPIPADG